MWRQGDVLIERVGEIPAEAKRLKRPILASGDATGQRHQIKDRNAARLLAWNDGGATRLFLEVVADEAEVVHPEHGEIVLPRGTYRVWLQREFTGFGTRSVVD